MPLKHGEMLDPEDPKVTSGAQGEIFFHYNLNKFLAMEYCRVFPDPDLDYEDQHVLESGVKEGHCTTRIFMETLEEFETYNEALVRGILIDEMGIEESDLHKMNDCIKLTRGNSEFPLIPDVHKKPDQNNPDFIHKRVIDAYRLPKNFELSWMRQKLKVDKDEKADSNKKKEILGVPYFISISDVDLLFPPHLKAVRNIIDQMGYLGMLNKAA